jgi:hypothetical protein
MTTTDPAVTKAIETFYHTFRNFTVTEEHTINADFLKDICEIVARAKDEQFKEIIDKYIAGGLVKKQILKELEAKK